MSEIKFVYSRPISHSCDIILRNGANDEYFIFLAHSRTIGRSDASADVLRG